MPSTTQVQELELQIDVAVSPAYAEILTPEASVLSPAWRLNSTRGERNYSPAGKCAKVNSTPATIRISSRRPPRFAPANGKSLRFRLI